MCPSIRWFDNDILFNKIKHSHGEYIDLAEEMIFLSQDSLLSKARLTKGYMPHFYAAACFSRVVVFLQGAITVAEKGNIIAAKALIRCAIDPMINLRLSCHDPNYGIDAWNSIPHKKKKWSDKLLLSSHFGERELEIDRVRKESNDAIIEHDIKHPRENMEELAKRADLSDFYYLHYVFLSNFVHSTPVSFIDCLAFDGNKPVAFKIQPDPKEDAEEWKSIFLNAMSILEVSAVDFADLFSGSSYINCDYIKNEIGKLARKAKLLES